jgi:hypothetical protein
MFRRSKPMEVGIVSLLIVTAGISGAFVTARPVAAVSTTVVISQVYGGGGNIGATLKNDFIELYNRGSVPVAVDGWTVQYASTSGSSWASTVLSGSIASHAYYLVQEGAGAGGTVNLPTPNATGGIAMSATAGKVALRASSTVLSGTCPTGLVDFVGYGSSTNCSESSPAPTLSNTTADLRKNGGATDTDNNAADFAAGAPNPRHSVSTDSAPSVASTVPATGVKNVSVGANLKVTFSEPVVASASSFSLSCTLSGTHPVSVSGGPASFTLDPASNFVDKDACTLVVLASQVHDTDTVDPPDTMAANKTVTFGVSLDQTGPTITAPPAATLRTGVSLSGTKEQVGVSWNGADNAGGTGLARYELTQSVNAGSWTTITTALVTNASVAEATSGTLQFRVRGIDKVGNAGGWSYGPTLGPRLVQQTAGAITFSGTWTTASGTSYSGGSVKYATKAGASASYTFTGRSITLVTTTASSRGQVKAYVDGVLAATLNTYSAATAYARQAWSKTWSASGTHTVKLVVVGTAGHPRVDLDAFGLLLPAVGGTVSATPLQLLAGLTTAVEQPTGYDRTLFVHWIDADGDGCDTRQEVLIAESLTPVKVGAGCALSGGSWSSAYDGVTTTDPSTFDIDHVVALKEAWDSGAYGWTADRRKAYANDLGDARTLRAVSSSSNLSKSDSDPAQWLPPVVAFRCTYGTDWVAIKVRWRLSVDSTERSALQSLLGPCPATPVTVVVQ